MIIKAKHNKIIYPFFQKYAIWKTTRNFKPVLLKGNFTDRQKPVFIISNHISWWDGFWIMYFNLKVIKRKFHFMMLEDQLKKFWFFNYSGGYSVNKNSKSIIESLNYTSDLLQDKNNMALMFPQGEIHSMHNQNFKFEKGLDFIFKNLDSEIQIIFIANITDYFSKPKTGLYIYYKEYTGKLNTKETEIDYNNFYKDCIKKQDALRE